MKKLAWAALWLSALLPCAPALADTTVQLPAGFAPSQALGFGSLGGAYTPVDLLHPLPTLGYCTVVSGDQAWALGSWQPLTCTTTGRLKVGLSSAALVGGTAALYTDLFGGVDPSGNQQPLQLDALKNLKAADANNASYTFAPASGSSESSALTSYTFTNTAQRGWYANCPASTTVKVTFTGVNGGTAGFTLYDGPQRQPDRITGYSGNTAGCTIGLLF